MGYIMNIAQLVLERQIGSSMGICIAQLAQDRQIGSGVGIWKALLV